MTIKINPQQSRKINALIRQLCCNYFKNAVLPADKELFADVMKTCNEKHCRICGKVFIPKSKNQRYCTE